MSRIGRKPIKILNNINVVLEETKVTVKGPQGQLSLEIPESLIIKVINQEIILQKANNHRLTKSIYGLYRTLINNMVIGTHHGFSKHLIIQGVGYRSQMDKNTLVLNIGYSHPVRVDTPNTINIRVLNNTNWLFSIWIKQLIYTLMNICFIVVGH